MAGDTRQIIQSLAVNLSIAAAKGVAAFFTGSGSLLAETIHSTQYRIAFSKPSTIFSRENRSTTVRAAPCASRARNGSSVNTRSSVAASESAFPSL